MADAVDAHLVADHLHLWRGQRHVLRGLYVEARAGEFIHLKGANGTGKTSLLRTLAGFLWPEEGEIRWCGQPVGQDRDGYAVAMAYLGHENALKGDLTALENLHYATNLRHATPQSAQRAVLERLGVAAQADLPTRVLSAGQKRRVAMARVLLSRATLWLLDEPFTNLDTQGVTDLAALVAEHTRQGGIALVTSHAAIALAEGQVRELVLA
ncbi:MAG: cytochrome c biogenesis heme-transporting ATPase CcmA [Pseudomonadota bacterium]